MSGTPDKSPLDEPLSDVDTGLEFEPQDPEAAAADHFRSDLGAIPFSEPEEMDPIRSRLTPSSIPVFSLDPDKITEQFAARQMSDIDALRLRGDYRRALQVGESFYASFYSSEFKMPLYRFLSEISARMCLLLDSIRNPADVQKWVSRLTALLDKLQPNMGDDFEIKHYVIILYLIRDFFVLCNCYLEKIKTPDKDIRYGDRAFEIGQWDYFASRVDDMINSSHASPKTADDIALRQRVDRLLQQLKNMVTRMKSVYSAEIDRWHPNMLMRDRDTAVRTRLCSPGIQKALKGDLSVKGAFQTMLDHIAAFPEVERIASPLVLSARVSLVRYLVDQGQYFAASQEATKLFPILAANGEGLLEAQLHGIVGYGLFVLADLLFRTRDVGDLLIHLSSEAKKFTDSITLGDIISNITNRGIDHFRVAQGIISRETAKAAKAKPPSDQKYRKPGAQLRNQVLFGYLLKMQAGLLVQTNEESGSGDFVNIFQRAVYDLDQIDDETELYAVYVSRLAAIIYHLQKTNPGIFSSEPMSALLMKVRNLCAGSLNFFQHERLVSLNPAGFETVKMVSVRVVSASGVKIIPEPKLVSVDLTENLDDPYFEIPWTDLTETELRKKSNRSGVPVQYFKILDEKLWYIKQLIRIRTK